MNHNKSPPQMDDLPIALAIFTRGYLTWKIDKNMQRWVSKKEPKRLHAPRQVVLGHWKYPKKMEVLMGKSSINGFAVGDFPLPCLITGWISIPLSFCLVSTHLSWLNCHLIGPHEYVWLDIPLSHVSFFHGFQSLNQFVLTCQTLVQCNGNTKIYSMQILGPTFLFGLYIAYEVSLELPEVLSLQTSI